MASVPVARSKTLADRFLVLSAGIDCTDGRAQKNLRFPGEQWGSGGEGPVVDSVGEVILEHQDRGLPAIVSEREQNRPLASRYSYSMFGPEDAAGGSHHYRDRQRRRRT